MNFLPYTYLLAGVIALHLWGAALIAHSPSMRLISLPWTKKIQFVADCSFALYLCHYPLLYLTRAIWLVMGGEASATSLGYVGLIYGLPFCLSFALAVYCEKLKGWMLKRLRARWLT